MKVPSFENLTIRALVSPPCPSATKMSPLGATRTSEGELKVSGPSPVTPALPSVIRTLPSGLNLMDLVTLGALAPAVGDPHIAIPVDVEAVRERQTSRRRSFSSQLAGWIDLEDWRHVRAVAARAAAALEHPDALAVAVDVDADRLSPFAPVWKLGPVLDRAIRIGRVASLRWARACGTTIAATRAMPSIRQIRCCMSRPPVMPARLPRRVSFSSAPRNRATLSRRLPPRQFLTYFISRLGPTSAP